ncbi:MAG: putative peptidoglycan biosynthesis protein MurJ [bacterium ADurb.Bin157]|nr:MAG: putative peptidoglycan biosynthesis protein MurJ [bacterium ADurb.Bin157]
MTQKNSIAKHAAVMGAATFISRIAGLIREQTFAYLFGASAMTDAFNVAFRIPNLLRDLFAEGAMSAAFVPTFNGVLEKEGKERAFQVTNLTLCALFLILGVLTLVGIYFSPEIVTLIAPTFAQDKAKFDVTVTMTRIMFPFLPVISFAAISMGILNSMGAFFIPAIAPVFLNLAMILAGWTLCPLAQKMDMPGITGMAIGAMVGGILQFLVQMPALYKYGYRFKWCINFNDPSIKRIFRLILPGTIGLAATQINVAISTILSTSQGDGAVSWLSYSFRIMQLPLGLFGVAVAQATLPAISKLAAKNDKAGMSSTLASSIRLSSFINLYACFAMIALANPIIRLIFQHGRFTAADTTATAIALQAYAVGLIFFSLIKILGPAFYALDNTKTPVKASIASVVVTIALNLILIKPCGYWGLALSTGLGAMVNFAILYFNIQKKLGSFNKYKLGQGMAKITFATLISGLTTAFALKYCESIVPNLLNTAPSSWVAALISMTAAATFGILILALTAKFLKLEEAEKAASLIKRKLTKKPATNQ